MLWEEGRVSSRAEYKESSGDRKLCRYVQTSPVVWLIKRKRETDDAGYEYEY